jgi:hypothetical protein
MQLQNSVYKNIVIIVNPRRRPQCLVTSTWARMRRVFFWSKLEHPCPTFEIHLSETRTWYTFRHWIIQNIPLQWLRLWTPIICNFFRWTKKLIKETFFTKINDTTHFFRPQGPNVQLFVIESIIQNIPLQWLRLWTPTIFKHLLNKTRLKILSFIKPREKNVQTV